MSTGKRNKLGLFLGLLFSSPSLRGGSFSHFTALLWGEECHAVLSASFTAFAAHTGHHLREQRSGDSHFLIFTNRLKNYAARILRRIETVIWQFYFLTCAVWHTPTELHGSAGCVKWGFVGFMNQSTLSETRPLPTIGLAHQEGIAARVGVQVF
jgi:hypothetical protein